MLLLPEDKYKSLPCKVPLALILPTTSNFSPGEAVPIPTLPVY